MIKLDSIILSRTTKITAQYLNKIIKVYNGITYHELLVTENMIGFKAGYFSPTRSYYIYKKSGKKN
jgi:ribosomal protein S19